MPSRGNGWQTPFSTRDSGPTLDVRWALDSPVHRPDRGARKRLRVSSVRNAEETWLHRDRTESVLLQSSSRQSGSDKSPRSWHGGTRHLPGACQLAPGWTRLGRLAQSRGSWALGRTYLRPSTSKSDSGAMQILANTDKHVDAVADLVERVRNEILKSLSRFSQRGTRVEVHLSDRNADRGGDEFGISRAAGRVASAFRRASFEVTAWDGRPLSCRGSHG